MLGKKGKGFGIAVVILFVTSGLLFASGGGEGEPEVGGVVNEQGEGLSIAAIDFPQFQPYKVRTESEMKAAEDYGIEYTLLQPPEVTVESYLETLTNAINQDFDAIICEPWDFEAFRPVLELAKENGVPMVSVHQQYPDPSFFISMLYIDNAAYGVSAADAIGEACDGKANVLFLMYQADTPNQALQRQSFIDRAAENWPDIHVVDTQFTRNDTMTAAQVLEASLSAYPEIDTAIWLEGATVTVGVDVAEEMGLIGDLRIVGIDDSPDVIAHIGDGKAWGTFVQNFWKQGYEAVRNIVDYYEGNPFPAETDAGIVLVDQSNWDNYIPSMWAPVALKGTPYQQQ